MKVLSFSLIVFSFFISSASWIFLSYIYGEMRTVFGYSQSNCPWHSYVCSVAPDNSHFPLMLSYWCSMHRIRTLFFDSPKYFPLQEKSNWYTRGWLIGSSLGLFFWQRICCRFFPDVKAISSAIFLNSRFIFGLMFGIQGNFFRFLVSIFSVIFEVVLIILFIVVFYYQVFQKLLVMAILNEHVN